MRIVIVGAGGHGQRAAESLQARAVASDDVEILKAAARPFRGVVGAQRGAR